MEKKGWLLAIIVVVAIFYFSTASVLFNAGLWEKYQDKQGVEIKDKVEINVELIGYFLDTEEMPSAFVGREASHMEDVKDVIKIIQVISWLLFVLGLYLLFTLKNPLDYVFKGALVALFILVILALVPFGVLFVTFHQLFFVPGTWTFPSGSFMITLYPPGFFADMFFIIIYRIVAVSMLSLIGCKFVTIKKFIYNMSILQ